MIYTELWKFLPTNHSMRQELVGSRPGKFILNTPEKLMRAALLIEDARTSSEPQIQLDVLMKQSGVKGMPILCRLPYWDWQKGTLLETMHIVYNQGKSPPHIISTTGLQL